MDIVVILHNPKFPGNVGAVARSMKNFGFHSLRITGDMEVDEEAHRRAKNAQDVLNGLEGFSTLDEAVKDLDLLVGTSGITNIRENRWKRNPVTPAELKEKIKNFEGCLGLLFGPEDTGLQDPDLVGCDFLVSIPANPHYPVLNLSHAVTVILYELFDLELEGPEVRKATPNDREILYSHMERFLELTDYPDHKRENTMVCFRRLMGRAAPSKWEFYTMMGVFARARRLAEGGDPDEVDLEKGAGQK